MKTFFFLLLCSSSSLVHGYLDPVELGQGLIQHKIANIKASKAPYNWTSSIFYYSLVEWQKALGPEVKADQFLKSFFAYKKFPKVTTPDLAPISLSALDYIDDSNEAYSKRAQIVVQNTYEWLQNEPRNQLGALNHIGVNHRFFPLLPKTKYFVKDSIWLDSLVMYALSALKISSYYEDENLYHFSLKQIEIFASKLQDSNGLLKHAYYFKNKSRTPEGEGYWLRGNGWVAMSCIEFLTSLSLDHPHYYKIKEVFVRLIDGLLLYQNPSGLFNTILTHQKIKNYEETSGSSLIGYAIAKAVRYNILPSSYLDKAQSIYQGLHEYIEKTPDGYSLHQISGPTSSSKRMKKYTQRVKPKKDLWYGVGALVLFAKEFALVKK